MNFKFTGIQSIKGNEIVAWLRSHQGQTYAACKPFCDGVGLSWGSQRDKLQANPRFSCTDISMTGSDGKKYQMVCLPVEQLADWVQSINPAKIGESKRPVLMEVQKFFQQGLHALSQDNLVSREEFEHTMMEPNKTVAYLFERQTYLETENARLRHQQEVADEIYQKKLDRIGGQLLSGARKAKKERTIQ